MAQNEKFHNISRLFGDMALTAVAVAIVAITYYGVSGLTPKSSLLTASNDQSVLGVSTKQRSLTYFPQNTNGLAYIKDFSLAGNTGLEGNAVVTINFHPLEASTYEFTVVTIKNSSQDFKKVQLTPAYSLEGSYTTISVVYAGLTSEILSAEGVVSPMDLSIPPAGATDIAIKVQPTTKLATPVTLSLDFTEVP